MKEKEEKTPEKKNIEEVLVVFRDILFPDGAHQGIKVEGVDDILDIIAREAQFLPRFQVEEDPSFKQIIPYLVFAHNGMVFLMQRIENHSEARLANLYSLGIGGHLRKGEIDGKDIFAWAKREFEEEVDYQGDLTIKVLGLLNDESNEVGKVHTGLVLLLEGTSGQIRVKDEHKSGKLTNFDEAGLLYEQMENWSKIVFETLKKNAKN